MAVATAGQRLATATTMFSAVIAILAVAAVPAGAVESSEGSEIPSIEDGGLTYPEILNSSYPEEYPHRLELGSRQTARQVNEHEVVVEYPDGTVGFTITDPLAHDADGTMVPTALVLSEGEILTVVVRHREGNPLAGGAPFVYPIISGNGWEGGWRSSSIELNEPSPPAATETAPAPTCTVPPLHGLDLHAAKSRLRAADCGIGQVHLAAGTSAGKGKVVKQFHPAGTQLAAGAPIAVKLGSGGRG